MISICIPVFNWNVQKLCADLSKMSVDSGVSVEILCIDDGSNDTTLKANEEIAKIKFVKYVKLSKNVGRSRIRNILFKQARYNICLFLDNDAAIPNADFINKYVRLAKPGEIIYGGTIYPINPSNKYQIHCKYGTERECPPYQDRNIAPYRHFKTNNFCLIREDFTKPPFDESIIGYGYEDNEFASLAQERYIKIIHIDNPVIHLGLMTNEIFIDRQIKAVNNLFQIKTNGSTVKSKLWETASRLENPIILRIFLFILWFANPVLKTVLTTFFGPLIFLDLLKLQRMLLLKYKGTLGVHK